jgi:urocanate hydratase
VVLGGMGGAQPLAATMAGFPCCRFEVDESASVAVETGYVGKRPQSRSNSGNVGAAKL